MWNLTELHPAPPASPSARPPHAGDWSESELAEAWAARRYRGHWLIDCCGRHLRVVFAGRRWGGPGPDFVGAVLALADGALVRGDVEVHVRASGWAGHRHAQDPAYRQVVLHVVAHADTLALDGRGGHVPTVVLEPQPARGPRVPQGAHAGRTPRVPCVRAAPAVLAIVRAAGRERFRARAARFEADLTIAAADQVVWRGVAEALGLRPNVLPFGQLAEAVPWPLAAQVVADRGPVGLAGLLLGSAGLVAEATLPEAHAWRRLQREHGLRPALRVASWDRRQVRAANQPAVRCRGLAELAARWVRGGPAEQVLDAVRAVAAQRRPRLWPVVEAGPWVGRGRAQVIAVNVLLPFAAAAGLPELAATLYERLPGEPPNRVLRYMRQQLGGAADGAVRLQGACLQQGLLQLFKATCATRRCDVCPARNTGRRPDV